MKRLIFLCVLLTIIFSGCSDSTSLSRSLKECVNKYSNFSDFKKGYAEVFDSLNNKSFIIDKEGNVIDTSIVVPMTDTIDYSFKWIPFNGGKGVMDIDGNIIIYPQYGYRYDAMYNGMAIVRDSLRKAIGYIDLDGRTALCNNMPSPIVRNKSNDTLVYKEKNPIKTDWSSLIGYDINKVESYACQEEGELNSKMFFSNGTLKKYECGDESVNETSYFEKSLLKKIWVDYNEAVVDDPNDKDHMITFKYKEEGNCIYMYKNNDTVWDKKLIYNPDGDLCAIIYRDYYNPITIIYDEPGGFAKDYNGNVLPCLLKLLGNHDYNEFDKKRENRSLYKRIETKNSIKYCLMEDGYYAESEPAFVINKKLSKKKSSNNGNNNKFVDLGLPSGLKWATCNVGASKPWQYGDYYKFDECKSVVSRKWGTNWRIPSKNDFWELVENCSFKWTTLEGKQGCMVINKKDNSKWIFFPAAGGHNFTTYYGVGTDCCYWSSTVNEFDSYDAYCLDLNSKTKYIYGVLPKRDRRMKVTVRPVTK